MYLYLGNITSLPAVDIIRLYIGRRGPIFHPLRLYYPKQVGSPGPLAGGSLTEAMGGYGSNLPPAFPWPQTNAVPPLMQQWGGGMFQQCYRCIYGFGHVPSPPPVRILTQPLHCVGSFFLPATMSPHHAGVAAPLGDTAGETYMALSMTVS